MVRLKSPIKVIAGGVWYSITSSWLISKAAFSPVLVLRVILSEESKVESSSTKTSSIKANCSASSSSELTSIPNSDATKSTVASERVSNSFAASSFNLDTAADAGVPKSAGVKLSKAFATLATVSEASLRMTSASESGTSTPDELSSSFTNV